MIKQTLQILDIMTDP